jgi:hypothetical protein
MEIKNETLVENNRNENTRYLSRHVRPTKRKLTRK